MSTTIKSTALDFNTIKNNLKTFFEAQSEFTDYDFEASGLSNLLDVLAYNTHYNALIANYALNESFLGTAQLRSSIVALASAIGYIPGSRTSSSAKVELTASLDVGNEPATITIPRNFKFNATIDDVSYSFITTEAVSASYNQGVYSFQLSSGDNPEQIQIYEGAIKTRTFLVGSSDENEIYVIPDKNLDRSTVFVRVYDTPSSTDFQLYTPINEATEITESSLIYVLKETPNGFFELSFGNGNTLGPTPEAGNKIVVEYISCSGSVANGGKVFTAAEKLSVTLTNSEIAEVDVIATTISNSSGGAEKETNESIKKNAPFQYTTQNRMVVAGDYSTLVFARFRQYIEEINSWGGEDNDPPEYGAVYMSIRWRAGLSASDISDLKISIENYVNQLSIVSWQLRFLDPITTYIETAVYYQYNPRFTTLGLNAIKNLVGAAVENYFNATIGSFGQSFRRSNLLTQVDNVDPSVLSSRADIKMQQRLTPTGLNGSGQEISLLGKQSNYNFYFPQDIASPENLDVVVSSSQFKLNGKTCFIRNRSRSTVLQVVQTGTLVPLVDNVGEYFTDGRVRLISLQIDSILGGDDFLKISIVPGNQSAVSPSRNNILLFDDEISFETPVEVTST
jgi:hypothetical protein